MVSARLEMSPKGSPWHMPMLRLTTKEVGGNQFEINVVHGKIQMNLFLLGKMQLLQNTLLKEKVLQEKVGISNSTLFSRFEQNRSLKRLLFDANCQVELM